MHITKIATVTAMVVSLGFGVQAQAAIVTYSGADDGASLSGPFTNSAEAQSGFVAAASAFGSVGTASFETLSTGLYTPIKAGPGLSISLNAADFGAGNSGISNTTFGNLYGFNTTSGGSNWLGFGEGSARFDFEAGTNALGFYLTGLQSIFTTVLTLTFDDGRSETISLPITAAGGAEYFGFTDTDLIFSATLSNSSDDAWGIDDVTYNTPVVSSVPEPATLALFGMGLTGLGLIRRRQGAMSHAVRTRAMNCSTSW